MNAAQLADSMSRPAHSEGYEAQRHPSFPDLVIVWATCGCYWVGSNTDNFITACLKKTCDYSHKETARALEALRQAEEAISSGIRPVGAHSVSDNMPEAGRGPGESVEGQISDMIAEGGPVDIYNETGGES